MHNGVGSRASLRINMGHGEMLCPFYLEVDMTHAEKEVRNQEIVKLRHDGKSMSEVAEIYQLTVAAVCHICKRYGVDGRMSDRKVENHRNQYTNGVFDREENAIQYINERTP